MSNQPPFDLAAAHKYFSVDCFNRAWDLIDKPNRTPEENEEMLRLSLASTWHWTQRSGCTPTNLSVSLWQTARIYALLGQADNARRYGQLCLGVSQQEGAQPFCLGFAYEALARAEMVAGNRTQMDAYLQTAHRLAERLTDPEDKKMLLNDLNTIQ